MKTAELPPPVGVKRKSMCAPSILPKRIVPPGLLKRKGLAVAVTDCVAPVWSVQVPAACTTLGLSVTAFVKV